MTARLRNGMPGMGHSARRARGGGMSNLTSRPPPFEWAPFHVSLVNAVAPGWIASLGMDPLQRAR